MTSWGDMVRRSDSTRITRKEDRDKPGSIHNEGKKDIPPKLIKLFKKILEKGDDFFKACPPESEAYSLKNKFDDIPVYLIPYEEYLNEMKNRCESDFAVKMRELYQKEIERIPQECNPEEQERRAARIKVKYSPWLPEKCPGSCKGCEGHMAVKGTPLGYFVPDNEGGKIYICYDRIVEEYPKEVDSIAAKVLLHELGHAIMFNPSHLKYETCFEYWAEESLANKIALNYLAVASKVLKRPALYDDAEDMVKNQESPYRFGLYLHGHNASDWASLRDNKTNINCEIADQWVNSACDQLLGYKKEAFLDLQRLFFSALGR